MFSLRNALFGAVLIGAACDVRAEWQLPPQLNLGGLGVGHVDDPGCAVRVDAQAVRVSAQGWFVIAAGRDAPDRLRIAADCPGGARHRAELIVQPRTWPQERVDGVPPATVNPPPEIAERIAREQARVAAVRTRDDARTDFLGGFIWPVKGRISGRFGSHRVYNAVPGTPHSGLDVAAPTGTPLSAPAAGVVSFADPDLYLTGGTLVIDHGHGLSSVFLHLSRIDVAVGQRLEQGEVFAAVGATGRASGPHMHWGMNWFQTRLDPELALSLSRPTP